MDISREHIDELNATINLKITTEDIEPKVNEALSKVRKTAQIKGFRQGKAPLGLIKKMYGETAMYEELNKLVSESLASYITDEKLELLGDPIAVESKNNDANNKDEYNFSFDIGLRPQFELNIDESLELPYYEIEVTDELIDKNIDQYRQQFGKVETCEEIVETAYIKADIAELDKEENLVEDGMKKENVSFSVEHVKTKKLKKELVGSKVGDKKAAKLKDILSGEAEIAEVLGIEKDEVKKYKSKFELTIKEITNFNKAELNEDLFKKVFPDVEIANEEEFRAKIKERVEEYKGQDSEYKFFIDAREYFNENIALQFPEEFLKRWLKSKNSDKEDFESRVDDEFPQILKHFRWQVILQKIIKDKEIKVDHSEVEDLAVEQLKMQFLQYGMPMGSISTEQLKKFAQESILSKQEEVDKLYDQQYEMKALRAVKESAKLNVKKVSEEEFAKFFEPEKNEESEEKPKEESKETKE